MTTAQEAPTRAQTEAATAPQVRASPVLMHRININESHPAFISNVFLSQGVKIKRKECGPRRFPNTLQWAGGTPCLILIRTPGTATSTVCPWRRGTKQDKRRSTWLVDQHCSSFIVTYSVMFNNKCCWNMCCWGLFVGFKVSFENDSSYLKPHFCISFECVCIGVLFFSNLKCSVFISLLTFVYLSRQS